jgi:hypothetical protein
LKGVSLVIAIVGISVLGIFLAGACLLLLPTQYAIMGITFIGGIWTPVISGMLIYWFNSQVKVEQISTRLEIASARQDILSIRELVDGNYSKMLRQLEELRSLNQEQRDIISGREQRAKDAEKK